MAKVLEVKNLKISFRTSGGRVKAVRNLSFNLEKGKTLAIVGESGSGKSVTSKAIMGILAGNAVVEGGEIIYDGKDLLKISEEEMCRIRGDEIAMIFQDPLSSLNPIVKIGKQITEAMLVKDKAGRRAAKRQYRNMLALLKKYMQQAGVNCENILTDAAALEQVVSYSFNTSLEKKKAVMPVLAEAKAYFTGSFTRKDALRYAKELADQVEDSIDPLEIRKDSFAYTLRSGLHGGIVRYFAAAANPNADDLTERKENLVHLVERLEARYQQAIANAGNVEMGARGEAVVKYLTDKNQKMRFVLTPAMAKEKAIRLMEEVGIKNPEKRYNQYPFEFSGGMRQRIVIAIALSADPEILICDEPTTALDVTIQAQILELINRLKKERKLSVVFITHDLGVVANMADHIGVMYAGKIVEYGTADEVFYDPRHPYTWALLSSMPDLSTKGKLDAIPGTPPNMMDPPVGDAFAQRNRYAMEIDFEQQPPEFAVSDTHWAATWLLHPDAPKVEIPKIITNRIAGMKQKAGDGNGK